MRSSWRDALLSSDVDAAYADLKSARVRRLFADGNMRRWQDIKPERVRDQLKLCREVDKGAISTTTSNHYLQAAQQFCKWMVDDQKRALSSPLAGMNPLDDTGKLVHERRALELNELHHLIRYLDEAPAVFHIPAHHRALIYTDSP